MKDHLEVCPLSREVILPVKLNLYPLHYKAAFASSKFLYPQFIGLALRFTYPCLLGRIMGLPRCTYVPEDGLGSACSPVVLISAIEEGEAPIPTTCLLAQAYQCLWLVGADDVY